MSGMNEGHREHATPANHAAHDKHAGHSPEMFRSKFWLSLALTVPIVVLSADVQMWLGYEVPAFPGSELVPALLGSVVFLYGGLVFMRGAGEHGIDSQILPRSMMRA